MPSPFPGMDPFLEHPEFFPDLHDAMVAEIRNALQPKLPAGYFAKIRTRAWIEYLEEQVEPDVSVIEDQPGATPVNGGAVATEVQAKVVYVPLDEQGEKLVEIHSTQGDFPLVTAIEILSPANKRQGKHSRDQYRQKQMEYLSSAVNLVEIDVLRGGQHTTAIPLGRARRVTGPFDYHVCVSRYADREHFQVYPVLLAQRLPVVAVPLRPGDPDVMLDLQAAFNRCYDSGPPYRRLGLYRQDLQPAPTEEQAHWISGLLAQERLNSTNSSG